MIGKLNHIAIAVPNIKEAAEQYKNIFGAKVSDPVEQPDHGVTTVFIDLGNTKIELLEVLGEGSPIQNFIDKNPKGGMHLICLEVNDINSAIDKLYGKIQTSRRRYYLRKSTSYLHKYKFL